jgi:hypothetical protein
LLLKTIAYSRTKVKRLTEKLNMLTENHGIRLDPDLQGDVELVVNQHGNEHEGQDSFSNMFWEQQVCNVRCK